MIKIDKQINKYIVYDLQIYKCNSSMRIGLCLNLLASLLLYFYISYYFFLKFTVVVNAFSIGKKKIIFQKRTNYKRNG